VPHAPTKITLISRILDSSGKFPVRFPAGFHTGKRDVAASPTFNTTIQLIVNSQFCQRFFRWYNQEMVKRKTFCGNAKMCSMLLTNVTRSASYEALPNHGPLPAKSGLTSRLPLRNRCLWEKSDETAAKALPRRGEGQDFLGDDQLPVASYFGKPKCA